ncbi:phytanoyl-CoA dioxygenase family protein [Glaciecola petra]|uniref:Phytanoyl-CoA dioxygenase family protein n=1 Tax=Glaciecola petra TaxID=3075602 RepID=A0ABU2ZMJ9_9ALTE|nr:phytanoyl-CoA dioxygenase family protein [Aestuariibacter sp. P117]MDT0593851.1 phytanoyl-CoA dioxygenase family protein [Aestuariibacter sp. P117]
MKTRAIDDSEIETSLCSLQHDGFCVLKQYIDPSVALVLAKRSRKISDQLIANGRKTKAPIGMQRMISEDRLVNNIINYDDDFLTLASAGDHLKILIPILNDPYYGLLPEKHPNYILGQANVREGTSALPFHVDTRILTKGLECWSMQGVLALSAKTKQTGGLRVRPGSHVLGQYPDSKKVYDDSISVDLKPGDFVLFDSQLHHATFASEVNFPGWSFNLTYRAWWVKQQFDFCKMLGAKKLKSLTPQQQFLLGACTIPSSDPLSSPSMRGGYELLETV